MRTSFRYLTVAAASAAALAGCGHARAERATNPEQAAQVAADSARSEGAPTPEVVRRAERARDKAREKNHEIEREDTRLDTSTTAVTPAAPPELMVTVNEGTRLQLASVTDLSSQRNKAGDPFVARTVSAALSETGDTIIPVGAELLGRVTAIKAPVAFASARGELALSLDTMRFDHRVFPLSVRVDSTELRPAQRGGNIVLSPGSRMMAVLTKPFSREVAAKR